MIFSGWQIGLDIQAEGARAVAVQRSRQGWQLRQWWDIPFPAGTFDRDCLSRPALLSGRLACWRKALPRRHQLRVSFPVQYRVADNISPPEVDLCSVAEEEYIACRISQLRHIPAAELYCDYLRHNDDLAVTAARQRDVHALLACLTCIRLRPVSVTPCDNVLQALPKESYPAACDYLVHEEPTYWLWAACNGGRCGWQDKTQTPDLAALCLKLNAAAGNIAFSSACPGQQPRAGHALDIWQRIVRQYPPIPANKGRYTLALGLALGSLRL